MSLIEKTLATGSLVSDFVRGLIGGDGGLARAIQGWTGAENCAQPSFIPQVATVDGTTSLRRTIAASSEVNEITISMWVWRDSGVNTSQKMYDIGDGVTSGNDTTRFRHNPSAVLKSILSNVVGGTYTEVSSVNAGSSSTEDSYHHLYMTAKNDLVDGVGTQVMELWEDNILLGTDTVFSPDPSTTFSFVAGDFVTLMARHDLSQFLQGRIAEVWSGAKYLPGATYVPSFRRDTPANTEWNGGLPVDLGVSGVVAGVTPGNWLGGGGYTLADWNNGVNRGANGDFTLSGNPIT